MYLTAELSLYLQPIPMSFCFYCILLPKKKTKASLFSGKERQLGKLEGRGTLRFSITLLIGCTDFDMTRA
jgi:hypothetical protein